ncbi:MAG: PaaI family thioesterase [Chloroflexota bacterium]|nr:PaaI family thioesterase [Chloroflexota bacterium]
MRAVEQIAFQDRMPFNHCWGCGADNPNGFQLKSCWDRDVAVADWQPSPEYMAGPEHVLNGGVISTLIDCHGVCTAIADDYRHEGREIGEGETIWYVTGNLNVTFLKPTPIDAPVHLEAIVARREGRKAWVDVTLSSRGEPRARGEVLAIRVPTEWLEERR